MVELLHRGPTPSASNALARHGDAPPTHSHAIGDVPTGTSGTTVALGNHTHSGISWSDRVFTITDSTSVTPNALSGLAAFFKWNMAAASTINPPSNPSEGQIVRVAVKPASALNLTIAAGFVGSSDYATGVVALASGKWTTLVFQYISDIGWQYTGKSVSA